MTRLVPAGLVLVLAGACNRATVNASEDAARAARPASPASHPEDAAVREAVRDAGEPASDVDQTAGYAIAAPLSGKSIGHTSVVFKLKLAGGLEAAYKPRSRRGHNRYKGEIAAYRLGRALGIRNVPLALPRSFDKAALERALGSGTPGQLLLADEAVTDESGLVPGALIPWIHDLGFSPLERSQPEWRGWLSGGVIPADKRDLAGDISTMVAFDYVTGNWDRWSGGNIGLDPKMGRLLFIDNDAAFFDIPPPGPLAGMRKQLEGVARFSRAFIEAARRLDSDRLQATFGDEAPGAPLLAPRVIAGVAGRLREVVQLADARIAKTNEADVLFFE